MSLRSARPNLKKSLHVPLRIGSR